jgi:hypothetical protein
VETAVATEAAAMEAGMEGAAAAGSGVAARAAATVADSAVATVVETVVDLEAVAHERRQLLRTQPPPARLLHPRRS